MRAKKYYKLVRRHPETGQLTDTYSGSLDYSVSALVEDPSDHGLSVHTTAVRAISHPVPRRSVGRDWPAVLLSVTVEADDVISHGDGEEKTLVRRLRVEKILEEPIHPDIAQRGLSAYRLQDARRWLADGWGGYRVVDRVTRGSPDPVDIQRDRRAEYAIECRLAASGRWGKSAVYRAVPIDNNARRR
jgi:hypothetical protein